MRKPLTCAGERYSTRSFGLAARWGTVSGVVSVGDVDRALESARNGDEEAWAVLYDSVAPQLLGYLRVRGAQDPESVMGDVFLHVARGFADFEGDESGFRSWVFVIATSRALDERRRLRRKPTETLEDAVESRLSGRDDVERDVMCHEEARAAASLLDVLTPDQRTVVELRIFGELTSTEVAAAMDRPVGAVKALYHRGIGALRREIERAAVQDDATALIDLSGWAVSLEALSAVTGTE